MSHAAEYDSLSIEYANSPVWQNPINNAWSGYLAFILLFIAISFISFGILSDKSSFSNSIRFIILSVFGSFFFGFGSLFLSNYVGVYV